MIGWRSTGAMLSGRRVMNDSNHQIYEQVWEISKDKHLEWIVPLIVDNINKRVSNDIWTHVGQKLPLNYYVDMLTMIYRHHNIFFIDEKSFV